MGQLNSTVKLKCVATYYGKSINIVLTYLVGFPL